MRAAYVRGLGLWTPGHADPAAWCRGVPDPEVSNPEAQLLSGALRRRASPLTRATIEAFQQAVSEAGCDRALTPSVWATAHGEHETAIAILDRMWCGDGKLSPTRFHNSVHNTASGYASIASHNRCPSTTLTGDRQLVGSAFLEAFCQLEAGASDVALVMADEPILPPFDARGARAPLAIAFALSSRPDGARAVLSPPRRDAVAPVKRDDHFGDLYVSAALALLERVVRGRPGTVALELEGGREEVVWCLDLELAT